MTEIQFQKPAPTPPVGIVKLMMKLGMNPPPPQPIPYPENWAALSRDDKYEFFKSLMLSTENRAFASEEVAKTYVRRTQRWLDVIDLKEPDCVPNFMAGGPTMWKDSGVSQADTFYDGEKLAKASLKLQAEFEPEFGAVSFGTSGKAFDFIGLNLLRWPGSSTSETSLPENTPFQYVEREVMPVEDYDQLINNPDGYFLRSFYPKIYDGLAGLSSLGNMLGSVEPPIGMGLMMNLGMGPVREAFDTISKTADLIMDHMLPGMLASAQISSQYGTPSVMGAFSKAPFDILGDTLRGTKGIMTDLYRRPDLVLAACDALTPMAIDWAVQAAYGAGVPFVTLPLHKGADGFMSNEQFEKFYWPSFRKVLMGIIDAGLIPMSFVEGSYNQRLDIMADSALPKGKSAWWFDQTDMKTAKEKFGSWAAVGGNVPSSFFLTVTPQELDNYCKKVIETCAPGGGYFLAPGAVPDGVSGEHLHVYFKSTKKYGVY